MKKQVLDVAVLSDIHLGAVGCKAQHCIDYLKTIQPKILILNGDIIDIWNFRKFYWPDTHMNVIKTLLKMTSNGTVLYYLTGNHDELLRKLSNLTLGKIHLRDNLVLNLNGQKCWFFHGDIFDVTMKYSKWLAKLGGYGYDLLILLNMAVNSFFKILGKEKFSLSKKVKDSVKKAVEFVDSFENTAIEMAFEERYDAVFCGHIHKPSMRTVERDGKKVTYYNSGDWIENLTALEFNGIEWSLFSFEKDYKARLNALQKSKSKKAKKGTEKHIVKPTEVEFAA
jgi:UDP-2,3-diacylglucosamine pyrophosphatase LpxH